MIDTLCLGGGGIKGISYLGALIYLQEEKYLDFENINNFVGTSVGSVISFFLNLGFNFYELKDFVNQFDFKSVTLDINCNRFLSEYGMDKGDKIVMILKTFLKEKLDVDDITFLELNQKTNKDLKIIATNYTKSKCEIFSHTETPDVSVILAIRMSISIPLVFTPVLFNDCYYVDGGITSNLGLFCCDKDTTLGIGIDNISVTHNLTSIQEYLWNLSSILLDSNTNNSLRFLDNNNINFKVFNIPCRIIYSVDFAVDKEKIDSLLEDGLDSAKKYYSNFVFNEIMDNMIEKVINLNSTK